MDSPEWKKRIIECLNSTEFLALSTCRNGRTWTCPVFFAYDEKFNFYFISQPGSKHMQNILVNGEISVAIYSTNQSAAGDVFGVQFSGKAVMLPDSEVEKAFQIYYARSPKAAVMKDNKPEKYKGSKVAWKFVKIIPSEIHIFDTKSFRRRKKVPAEAWKN